MRSLQTYPACTAGVQPHVQTWWAWTLYHPLDLPWKRFGSNRKEPVDSDQPMNSQAEAYESLPGVMTQFRKPAQAHAQVCPWPLHNLTASHFVMVWCLEGCTMHKVNVESCHHLRPTTCALQLIRLGVPKCSVRAQSACQVLSLRFENKAATSKRLSLASEVGEDALVRTLEEFCLVDCPCQQSQIAA